MVKIAGNTAGWNKGNDATDSILQQEFFNKFETSRDIFKHTLTLINLHQRDEMSENNDRRKKERMERDCVGVNCEYLRKRGGINEWGRWYSVQGDGTGPLKIGRV